MRAKIEQQKMAIKLREQGNSVKEIARCLSVSPSSVSAWTKDVLLTEEQMAKVLSNGSTYMALRSRIAVGTKNFQEKCAKLREQYQAKGREDARLLNLLHIQGCMLYWGEGGKNSNSVRFVNTDGHMIKLFVKFLTDFYLVPMQDIKLIIKSHIGNGKTMDEIIQHWISLLDLTEDNITSATFYKNRAAPRIKQNRHIFGVCEVAVYKTEIVQRIFGAIQKYGNFCNEDWLRRKR